MHLPEGSLLQGGKYRIVRFISNGGFGCTYEAVHTMMNSRVAIKEFFVQDFCERDSNSNTINVISRTRSNMVLRLKKKFMEEARSVFDMHHPGIVRVIDIFEENGTAYFVMDYVVGESLQQILKRQGPMPEAVAVNYILQVCDALNYVHNRNRLHLDVKPGNIMVNQDGKAILIDFGASKYYDTDTGENVSTLMAVNTPGYAPVEQLTQSFTDFNPATDIYALGATLYTLLTGIVPSDAVTLMNDPSSLPPLPANISPATRAAVQHAMQAWRKDRPQSVDEFANELLGKGRLTQTVIQPVYQQSSSQQPDMIDTEYEKPKSKTGLWIGLTVIVLALVGTGVYFWQKDNDKPRLTSVSAVDNSTTEDHRKSKREVPESEVKESEAVEEVVEVAAASSHDPLSPGSKTFHGSVVTDGNAYPITLKLHISNDGSVSGRYCYDRIIKKYGDDPKNYFTVKGDVDGDGLDLYMYEYNKPDLFERWRCYMYDDTFQGTLTNMDTGTVMEVYFAM